MKRLWFAIAALYFAAAANGVSARPALIDGPAPAGISTRATDLDGVVYVDARGHTLYTSPLDKDGHPSCDGTRFGKATRTISGITYYLPAADERMTCVQAWPPLLVSDKATPVGDWTIVQRSDGQKQWAFRNMPVYRSYLDAAPGDVAGSLTGPDGHKGFNPLRTELGLPPGVITRMTKWGRVLAPVKSGIFYVHDKGRGGDADCDVVCRNEWLPFLAPAEAKAQGDWSVVSLDRGLQQWAFKGKPLFTAARLHEDMRMPLMEAAGWRPAVYQPRPVPPADFSVTQTAAGLVYADRAGHTVYYFNCVDETPDHLFCDVPGTTQITRVKFCGGPEKCMRTWRPVLAGPHATSNSRIWTVVKLDPKTGSRIPDAQPGGLAAWAYRGRPLYTYVLDKEPGDAYGDGVQNLQSFEVEMINLEFNTSDTEFR